MRNDAQLEHVDPETLTLFAMNALGSEEYARVQKHLDDCIQCPQEVQQVQGDLGLLAIGGVEIVTPPAHLKARLMAEVNQPSREVKSRPGSLWKWAFTLSSALALVMVGVALVQRGELRTLRHNLTATRASLEHERVESENAREIADLLKSSNSVRVTLVSSKSRPEPEAHTTYDQQTGRVLVVANHLAALPAERTYELWLLPKSGAAPIPAGLFRPDANGNAQMFYTGISSGQEAKGFAVTVEPRQGSQAPTTTPLLVGLAGA